LGVEISYQIEKDISQEELHLLYSDAGWTNYTKDIARLERAVKNSSLVITARKQSKLVGLLRSISDEETIAYIQDIVVLKSFQGSGIGTGLIEMALEHYNSLRQIVLLTDDLEKNRKFYESVGLKSADKWKTLSFLKINEH